MNNDMNSIQKASYELTFPEKSAVEKAMTDPTLPISKLRSIEYAFKSIQKYTGKNTLVVAFEVPKKIQQGLRTGEYIRKGGVIVTSEKGQVVKWLKEGKNISKLSTVVFSAIEIFSEIALNEKLKQIQHQLDEIAEYAKAKHDTLIPMAHESLRHAILSSIPSERTNFYHKAELDFQKAQNEMQLFAQNRIHKIHIELIKFNNARLSNVNNLKNICNNLNELIHISKGVAHCMEGRVAINTELGNIDVATDIKLKLVDFLSNVGEYTEYIIEGNSDYYALEFVKQLQTDSSSKIPSNKITARIKRFTLKDLQFPHPITGPLKVAYDALYRKRFHKAKDVSNESDSNFGEKLLNKHLQLSQIEDVRIMVVNYTDEILKDSGLSNTREENSEKVPKNSAQQPL